MNEGQGAQCERKEGTTWIQKVGKGKDMKGKKEVENAADE